MRFSPGHRQRPLRLSCWYASLAAGLTGCNDNVLGSAPRHWPRTVDGKTCASAANTTWPLSGHRSMAAPRIGPAHGLALRVFAKSRLCMDLIASSSAWIYGSPFPCATSATCLPFPATLKRRSIRSVRAFRTSTPVGRFPWCSAATIPLASRP